MRGAVILVLDESRRRRYVRIISQQLRDRRAPDIRLFHTAAGNPQAALLFARRNAGQVWDGCLALVETHAGEMTGSELLVRLKAYLGDNLNMMVVMGDLEDPPADLEIRSMEVSENPQRPLAELLREFLSRD